MEKSVAEKIELLSFMKKMDFFSMLSEKALWPLVNVVTLLSFKKGELLITENTDPAGIYMIQKGTVEIFKTLQDGGEPVITELKSGHILGEVSSIDKMKTTASVRAIEEVDCLFISEWDFTTQMHAYPETLLGICKKIYSLAKRR